MKENKNDEQVHPSAVLECGLLAFSDSLSCSNTFLASKTAMTPRPTYHCYLDEVSRCVNVRKRRTRARARGGAEENEGWATGGRAEQGYMSLAHILIAYAREDSSKSRMRSRRLEVKKDF